MHKNFDISARDLFLAIEQPAGDANETKIFGKQPIIDIRDSGTLRSAHPLRKQWTMSVALNVTHNGGVLSGNTTVPVVGTRANFTDLRISTYGVGFVLRFESNFGHTVSFVLNVRMEDADNQGSLVKQLPNH